MSNQDHADLIARFSDITGEPAERSSFYLESAAWKLDVALGSFYESSNVDDQPSTASAAAEPVEHQPSRKPKQSSNFGTISGLKDDEDDSSSDDTERQAFYTGGSEHGGGQQVLGPPEGKKNPQKFVQQMFKSAREKGAEEVESSFSGAQKSSSQTSTFTGSGYRLGETEGPSERVEGAQAKPKQVDVVLRLWKTGFTVDDGPIRDYYDSDNKAFLTAIQQGEIPRELIQEAKGGEVQLNMEDHRDEDYVARKQKMKAFTGQGHTLGSPAPEVVQQLASGSSTTTLTSSKTAATETKTSDIVADPSKPTTTLQIRLADGSRMSAKFNHTHTIADVRQHILCLHPQYVDQTFVLMTTFPSKELSDFSQTLADANLINAVIVQRKK